MINKEKDTLLRNLIKIETGIAKIYSRLSTKKEFTAPVRQFWRSIALEEEVHADILDEIRQGINNDSIPVVMDIDIETLKEFVSKVNSLTTTINDENLSDSDAYSLASLIESDLDEAGFIRKIQTTDQKFINLLKKIENDTKKHRVMMVNYFYSDR